MAISKSSPNRGNRLQQLSVEEREESRQPPPLPPIHNTDARGRESIAVLPRLPRRSYSYSPQSVSEQEDYYVAHVSEEESETLDSSSRPREALPERRRATASWPPNQLEDYYVARVVAEKPVKKWNSRLVLQQIEEFDGDFGNMERKMHTFPLALSHFRQCYRVPVLMPLGPYTDMTLDLDTVDTVKNVATHHFRLGTTFGTVDEMFNDFCSAVGDVRRLCQHTDDFLVAYRKRAVDDDALLKFNMLRDGCLLLEYMQVCTIGPADSMPKLLMCYLDSNKSAIDRDIMLMENQLPWVVIETLGRYKPQVFMTLIVKEFVAKMARTLQVRKGPDDSRLPDLEGSTPPHLLGHLRSYKIGYRHGSVVVPPSDDRPMSKTISAIELAEIGIKLKASKTTRFIDMGIKHTLLGAEIFMAPLLLDEIRLCWLVNMAAFELCVATYAASSSTDDVQVYAEKRAVSAFLVLLAMLMDREEDVHALRSKGLLQAELTDKEILDFFKDLVKSISGGPLYAHLMREIEDYKIKRWVWIKLYKFIYKNYRTIATLLSVVGVLAGIFKTLLSLKQH